MYLYCLLTARFINLLTDFFNLNFLFGFFRGKVIFHCRSLNFGCSLFLDFLCHHFFFGILSPDDFFQFGYLVQFLRREVQVALDAQPMNLHFLHLVKRHIAQLPAVAHRDSTETNAALRVVLQKISRVSSHREEIACIGDLIAYQSFLCAVQFR